MRTPTPRRLWNYLTRRLRLKRYLQSPGDGRRQPQIPAQALLWAMAAILRQAKRNKAFDDCRWIGLAVDGTAAGRRRRRGCPLCRPIRNAAQEVVGYRHHFTLISVVGTGLSLRSEERRVGRECRCRW